jgi:dynein heavy chain 2
LIKKLNSKLFQEKEWEFFVGQLILISDNGNNLDIPSWVPNDRVNVFKILISNLVQLSSNANFRDSQWSFWITDPKCETNFPDIANQKLSTFQKLLIIHTLRPDRIVTFEKIFIETTLGCQITPQATNLVTLYEFDSIETEPILFITTPGTDPTQEIKDFAEKKIGIDNFVQVNFKLFIYSETNIFKDCYGTRTK